MPDLAAKFSSLNPFKGREDDDDKGEEFGLDSVGGGGRGTHHLKNAKHELRVSHALRSFIVQEGILPEREAGLDTEESSQGLRDLLNKSHFSVPKALLDRSHPLPEYFISSSHNTYLIAHQLYGSSSAEAYETALKTGARCVEIDAWDNSENKDEPKVTHGLTLVSHIPFRTVCETIAKVHDEEAAETKINPDYEPAPIMISLENHCGDYGQRRLVAIMQEVWGDRLLSEEVRREGHREQAGGEDHVTLEELGAKIVVIVEYHLPNSTPEVDSSSSDEEDDDVQQKARKEYKENKLREESSSGIVPELAALGVYAQSVKPSDNTWYDPGTLVNGPPHHLINVSESGLSKHIPANSQPISRHNGTHLMRVFPKGTRIFSSNLRPVAYWGVGAQICALNWQTFSGSNQINDALFSGSDGYVLKPAALRSGGVDQLGTGKKKKLLLHVAGASNIPLHEDREADSIKPYLTCTLYSATDPNNIIKRKTDPYKQHKLGFLHRGENPLPTDPIWNETMEWDYEDNELVFLRMLIKSDDSWVRNPIFAVSAVRLNYAIPGWSFVRMMDLKGRETQCIILVKFEIVDA